MGLYFVLAPLLSLSSFRRSTSFTDTLTTRATFYRCIVFLDYVTYQGVGILGYASYLPYFICGFVLGWLTALLRNFVLHAYLQMVKTRANLLSYFESLD